MGALFNPLQGRIRLNSTSVDISGNWMFETQIVFVNLLYALRCKQLWRIGGIGFGFQAKQGQA